MVRANLGVADLADLIATRTHFAEAAYRDGEWRCILGDAGGNVNGEQYDPQLRTALTRTLLEPAGQWCAYFDKPSHVRKRADAWVAQHRPRVAWIRDRVLGQAVVAGMAAPLFAAMRTRRVIVVGPAHMAQLDRTVLAPAAFVTVDQQCAWRTVGATCSTILKHLQPDDLVLFCAGMGSNVMIHRLWRNLEGDVTLYDAGAALDPYCGVFSRTVYRTAEWRRTNMKRNIP